MSCRFAAALLGSAMIGLLHADCASAVSILTPGDPIVGIDLDPPHSNSSYPSGEAPQFAVDGTLAKYLNFAGAGSGFIATPNIPVASIVTGIQLTTANDAEGRDPSSFEVWGTNDPIVSADNSTGLDENWTLIATDSIVLPADRNMVGPLVSFANSDAYKSYKVLFPTVKGSSLMQVAEVELIGDVPGFGSGLELFQGSTPTVGTPLAIQFGPDSKFPAAEGPANVIDGDSGTKYLNFGKENSGFIVTPTSGASTVKSFRITTANDSESRDPTTWELWGTDDTIMSEDNSQGDGENWVLIDSGSVDLPVDRLTPGPYVIVDNDTMYSSYRMVFPTIRDAAAGDADSMQIADIQFYTEAIPEPGSIALGTLALLAAATVRRRWIG